MAVVVSEVAMVVAEQIVEAADSSTGRAPATPKHPTAGASGSPGPAEGAEQLDQAAAVFREL